jgi:hypothetical protein
MPRPTAFLLADIRNVIGRPTAADSAAGVISARSADCEAPGMPLALELIASMAERVEAEDQR